MNSKLRAQVFTMAVAALGIGATACAKKSEPAAPETPAATSGAEESQREQVLPEPRQGTPGEEGTAPATEGGSAEGQGGESSCGGGSCGSSGGK